MPSARFGTLQPDRPPLSLARAALVRSLAAAKPCGIDVGTVVSTPERSPSPKTLVVEAGKWPLTAEQQTCVQASGAASEGYRRWQVLCLVLGTSYLFDDGSTGQPSKETLSVIALPEVQSLGNLSIKDVAQGFAAWMATATADCSLPQLATQGGDPQGACMQISTACSL